MSALIQAIGAFVVRFFLNGFGRKWPAVVGGILTFAGTAVHFTSVSRGALLAGKMVNCLGVGAVMAAATSYASEVRSQKIIYKENCSMGTDPVVFR